MAEKHGTGGKAIVNFTKRAKRVQEKMMQKFGKSDQTKDEVYEEFVVNFNKQHLSAGKLQKELTKYMNALRLLNQSTRSLADTIDDLYEPDWDGRPNFKSIIEKQGLLWDDKLTTLQSKMVEPMAHYVSRFPEVKSRIQKRERKVVDYDLTRRELEHVKAKPKVTEQKVQQAEEAYTQAKQLYDDISDELYEELPSFYDSRIQFYASLIQSIATTEAKFHSEMSKVDEELADLMDSTASQAATGLHSTKRERSIVDKGPRLLSRPGEESEPSSDSDPPPPLASKPTTTSETLNHSPGSSPVSTPSSTPTPSHSSNEKPSKPPPFNSPLRQEPPSKPARSSTSMERESASLEVNSEHEEKQTQQPIESPKATEEPIIATTEVEATSEVPPTSPSPKLDDTPEGEDDPAPKSPPPKPEPPSAEESEELNTEEETKSQGEDATESESTAATEPPTVLFKVKASHPYKGDDDDELTFEKGDIILVIPYDDPEDEEDGWNMGIVESTNKRGVFPANFTKPLS